MFVQEILYNFTERVEYRYLEVANKILVCRFPFHMGVLRYLVHERTIGNEIQVCWEIVVGLNQLLFTKIGSQVLIKVNCGALISKYKSGK